MASLPDAPIATHLEYYLQHGLNPVHYEMTDPQRHLERRASLYRTLGIPPLAIRSANVLEVAPGSGQNSLYLASCAPRSLTLVEPNPTALQDIRATYERYGGEVEPHIVCSTLQDFQPQEWYDFVVCENWLGSSAEERALLRKLGTFLAPGGLLAITTVSPVGVLWNVLRKALTCRVRTPNCNFNELSEKLCRAFGPHLQTIPGMTRTVQDWVHDNVMNPAYLGIMLSIPMAIAELGSQFDVLGSSPKFSTDWRWFKQLCGSSREFNHHFLMNYAEQLHNFLDYREMLLPQSTSMNTKREEQAVRICEAVKILEANPTETQPVIRAVQQMLPLMQGLPQQNCTALNEFLSEFSMNEVSVDRIAEMPEFSKCFGRETVYVSFEKR